MPVADAGAACTVFPTISLWGGKGSVGAARALIGQAAGRAPGGQTATRRLRHGTQVTMFAIGCGGHGGAAACSEMASRPWWHTARARGELRA
ncbi:hypothetical protein OPT61_g4253 [Boeremia exigua]|uniref:Uncharacterized protein n=1 Tax=Boeremia exigua TaxID=749465 RepID=A0ACC2IF01_9PLEO|nr:hypothetical protein OPT61_g4253 [Boeremia exigua]